MQLTIPFSKSYVHGYITRRNGRLVYVNSYQNSKSRKQRQQIANHNQELPEVHLPRLKYEPSAGHTATKPVILRQDDEGKLDFIIEAIIHVVKTIDHFEPGEIVKLSPVLLTAKSILKQMGYYDATIAPAFEIPKVKRTKLSKGSARETAAMAKEMTRLAKRVVKAKLRTKIQEMGELLAEAI